MTQRLPSSQRQKDQDDVAVDFLVIGSGIAGLWTALRLADHGRVIVVTKKDKVESNTNYAQGGIAAVVSKYDSIDAHAADTINVGAGLCHKRVVRRVIAEGPAMVGALIEAGVRFSYRHRRHAIDTLDVGLEGGHSVERVVHAADLTGREIESALLNALRDRSQVTLCEHHLAIDLLVTRGRGTKRCVGALILDRHRHVIKQVMAPVTVLASGGAGQVYQHTTNPGIATGDGVAMAFRAGCRVANMEFVQFHPTRLCAPGAGRFLISEALRGAGGILRNSQGHAFMAKVHPLADLAPRDVVARAIVAECRRTRSRCAFLDLTHLKASFVRQRFPNIHRFCRSIGLDITRDLIPVLPAAHYMCGGVMTDRNARTDLPGLWAAGEVACTGLHGANRLASNSLLEAMVYAEAAANSGRRARRRLSRESAHLPTVNIPSVGRISRSRRGWLELRRTMWQHVGISRNQEGLRTALDTLKKLGVEAEDRFDREGVNADTIEYRNAVLVSTLIATGAWKRRESRGLHDRSDYPTTDDRHWRVDTVMKGPRLR